MTKEQMIKNFFLLGCIGLMFGKLSVAQDSSKRRTIEITSTFKPVLREAAKINFNAAPPSVDSSRSALQYNIPIQTLFLTYQPLALKPLALQIDSGAAWKYSNYIKAGVGNVHIPFLQAGFTLGDTGNAVLNVFANHYSSKGGLPFQKNNQTGVAVAGALKTANSHEWNGRVGFISDDYFFYGFQPEALKFTKDELRQRFQTFEGKISLRNTAPTRFGLYYNPSFRTSVFSGKNEFRRATETNTILNLPVSKTFGKSFGFNAGFTADLTSYRLAGKSNVQNNLFYFSPAFLLKTPNLYLHAGLIPSWDNKIFAMLPNFQADVTTNDKRFTLQLGWLGYYNKGSYQRFASINPWIIQPDLLLNTRVQERFVGFKGSVLNHFTYNAKLAFIKYTNMPLFVNDSIDGKTFLTLYSPALDALQLHGEIGYLQGETFSAMAALTINKFSRIKGQQRAWGLIPIELKSSLRWQFLKDLWLKGDLFAWDGAAYRARDKAPQKGEDGFDVSAGVEFRINRQFNLWLQMNNILNNRYERWNQYEVYGFNLLGGVVFSF